MSKINEAILAVMKELPSVVKSKKITMTKGGNGYKALSYDDLIEEIQPLFVKNGITMSVSALDVSVKTIDIPKQDYVSMNFMVSGIWEVTFCVGEESRVVRSFGYALDTSDKADGKACTYATKSAIVKCFSLQSEDEEEARPYASQTEPRNYSQDKTPPNKEHDSFAGKPIGPSEKQINFIRKLAKEKGVSGTVPRTSSDATKLITELVALPDQK